MTMRPRAPHFEAVRGRFSVFTAALSRRIWGIPTMCAKGSCTRTRSAGIRARRAGPGQNHPSPEYGDPDADYAACGSSAIPSRIRFIDTRV